MNIVVLAGGLSPERDVSLSSGSLVANALIENGHSVFLLDLYEGTDVPGSMGSLFISSSSSKRYSFTVPEKEPDLERLIIESGNGKALIGKNVLEICRYADLVFVALHGDIGENGKLQAVFDSYGVKYTGTGYTGSLLAMDKDLAKKLMQDSGILTADWITVHAGDEEVGGGSGGTSGTSGSNSGNSYNKSNSVTSGGNSGTTSGNSGGNSGTTSGNSGTTSSNSDTSGGNYGAFSSACINEIAVKIGFPCVVKPCGCGSSVGVSIVNELKNLDYALKLARKYDRIVLVERYVRGREFSVGVLGGVPLPPIEIVPSKGFYDYVNKYQAGMATEICPAVIPIETYSELQSAAMHVHGALRLGDYSRIEFILDKDGNAHCLEANTLPGMTPTSLLPQEAAAAGMSYDELCERIVALALLRK